MGQLTIGFECETSELLGTVCLLASQMHLLTCNAGCFDPQLAMLVRISPVGCVTYGFHQLCQDSQQGEV